MKYTIDIPNDIDDFAITYSGTTKLIKIIKEKRTKLIPYRVKRICPECNEELEYTNNVLLSSPPKYKHKCKKCNYEEYLDKEYPYIDYEEEEE